MSKSCYEYPGSAAGERLFNEAMIDLRDCLRLLWSQHVYWTRMVILGIAFDSPDLEATTNRLLRNAPDFARLFRHFYRKEIADEFGRLITDHLTIAADLVTAAKAGDKKAAAKAERNWYANADEIICFLDHINPCWPTECMKPMWYEHLSLTKEEAIAALTKNFTKSIEIFDQIEKEALCMADLFSDGLICQFRL